MLVQVSDLNLQILEMYGSGLRPEPTRVLSPNKN